MRTAHATSALRPALARLHPSFGRGLLVLVAGGTLSCTPRAAPLVGAPAPAGLPVVAVRAPTRTLFRWEIEDGTLYARGDGVGRVAPPDSARLDFFVENGFGGGTAFLFADSVEAPGGDFVRRLLPPPALLWAAFGRLAVPPSRDTTASLDGGILRADIGTRPVFRATFEGPHLRRLERIEDGRVREWVSMPNDTIVEYLHEASRRHLILRITRVERGETFDASIWNR